MSIIIRDILKEGVSYSQCDRIRCLLLANMSLSQNNCQLTCDDNMGRTIECLSRAVIRGVLLPSFGRVQLFTTWLDVAT